MSGRPECEALYKYTYLYLPSLNFKSLKRQISHQISNLSQKCTILDVSLKIRHSDRQNDRRTWY